MRELLDINGKANKASFYMIFKVWYVYNVGV